MAEADKSFWQTLPGIITAIAALITALGGLLGILIQNDVIALGQAGDSSGQTSTTSTSAGDGTSGGASEKASSPGTAGSGLVAWSQAAAALVRKDGSSALVKAATVGLACNPGTLEFENGQRMSLELVRTIEFDAIYTENASADGTVTLLDGQQLTDPIHTWNCPVSGKNELGAVEIALDDIDRIEFQR